MKEITILNQVDSNQFTFYDNDNNIILSSFEGFEYPKVRESIEEVSGGKSAYHINTLNGRREFSFIGDIIGSTAFTLRRSLLNCLKLGSLKLIKFTTYDDLELQCEAELISLNNPYNHSVHTFNLTFVAPDWRFFTQEEFEFTTVPTTIKGGTSIPANIPMEFPSSEIVEDCVVNNGHEKADPIFTIHGPGTLFRIINQDTEEEFTINQTLTDSEEIVINTKNRTIIFNGNSIMNSLDGDLWYLKPGDNCIGFIVIGSDANTLLTVNWRDAYLGI